MSIYVHVLFSKFNSLFTLHDFDFTTCKYLSNVDKVILIFSMCIYYYALYTCSMYVSNLNL